MGRPKKGQLFEYVVYKGDDIICHGTAEECSEKMGVTVLTVQRLATTAYMNLLIKRKKCEGSLIAVKIPVDELELSGWN